MIEEGDMVLCTVDRIAGTVVFVKIEGEEKEGNIILSEIAPGRIRNLREYVIPKKKIVCKVLKTTGGTIALSLRRVTPKERNEVMEEYNQERGYINILKSVLKEKSESTIENITSKEKIYNFFEKAKEEPKILEEIIGKEDANKILNILFEQKKKRITIKKTIYLKTNESNGVYNIKEILGEQKGVEIKYISAGKYSINLETDDGKKGEQKIKTILEDIEKKSKEKGVQFEIK